MPYYGVVANGQCHIVETWSECKALTHRVSNAKYEKFYSRNDAVEFIDRNMLSLGLKESIDFENNLSLVPCFSNSKNTIKGLSSEVFITTSLHTKQKSKLCPISGKYFLDFQKSLIGCGSIISSDSESVYGFNKEELSTAMLNSKSNVFSRLNIEDNLLEFQTNLVLIKMLNETLLTLTELGYSNVHITTDNNYLTYLLKENIFNNININILNQEIENKKEIKDLYKTVRNFNSVFITKQTLGSGSYYLEYISEKLKKELELRMEE